MLILYHGIAESDLAKVAYIGEFSPSSYKAAMSCVDSCKGNSEESILEALQPALVEPSRGLRAYVLEIAVDESLLLTGEDSKITISLEKGSLGLDNVINVYEFDPSRIVIPMSIPGHVFFSDRNIPISFCDKKDTFKFAQLHEIKDEINSYISSVVRHAEKKENSILCQVQLGDIISMEVDVSNFLEIGSPLQIAELMLGKSPSGREVVRAFETSSSQWALLSMVMGILSSLGVDSSALKITFDTQLIESELLRRNPEKYAQVVKARKKLDSLEECPRNGF